MPDTSTETVDDALQKGMQEKAIEFVKNGSEIYHKA